MPIVKYRTRKKQTKFFSEKNRKRRMDSIRHSIYGSRKNSNGLSEKEKRKLGRVFTRYLVLNLSGQVVEDFDTEDEARAYAETRGLRVVCGNFDRHSTFIDSQCTDVREGRL